MMYFNNLDARAVRERVNQRQLWEAWLEAELTRRHSFMGSLDWESRNDREYLYSRKRGISKSLGPRSPETEAVREAFHTGRAENAERLKGLAGEMTTQAAIVQSLGLGRVPQPAARILRALRTGLVRPNLRVVGTNALYAYEALAGVVVSADSTATGDIDVLVDDRNRLKFVLEEGEVPGIANLLAREVDASFKPRGPRDFRLTNSKGYMVEFIRPEPRPLYRKMPGAAPAAEGDVEPAMIEGLQWLVNAPAVDTVVLDERGFPAPMRAPDPRYWAAHKLWLSEREHREPAKKIRDRQQGEMVFQMITEKLPQYAVDEAFLAKLPKDLKAYVSAPAPQEQGGGLAPDW